MYRIITLFMLLTAMMPLGASAASEFKAVNPKNVSKSVSAEFMTSQTTPDGYHYMYDFIFVMPEGRTPQLLIVNSTNGTKTYTIERYAGSSIRKEFWLKDADGNDVSMVIKIADNPQARNSEIYTVTVDKYPGRRPNQKSIDATVSSKYYVKNGDGVSQFLFSDKPYVEGSDLNWKAGGITALFGYLDAHLD